MHEHFSKLLEAKEQRDTERFQAQCEMTALALTAADRAVTKAETATEKRFESVNEFRSTLSDQSRTLMPRAESELQFKAVMSDISGMKEQLSGRTGQDKGHAQTWAIVLAVLGAAGTIFGIAAYFHK